MYCGNSSSPSGLAVGKYTFDDRIDFASKESDKPGQALGRQPGAARPSSSAVGMYPLKSS